MGALPTSSAARVLAHSGSGVLESGRSQAAALFLARFAD